MTARPDQLDGAAEAWDVEYAAGRYRDEPPLPFVADVLSAVREHDLLGAEGLYVGCGNGRNYLPLVQAGLDLVGLDVSAAALAQLAERAPERRARLIHGELSALPAGVAYAVVVLAARLSRTWRVPPERGQWSQWEAIYRKPA